MKIYTVRDTAADYFLPPYFARTDDQAKRMFIGSLGDSFPYRRDFGLFLVGEFDEETGVINGLDPVQVLAGLSIPEKMDPNVTQKEESAVQ